MANQTNTEPAGYEQLLRRYEIDAIPNWHRSYIASSGPRRMDVTTDGVEETYSAKYRPNDSLGAQLEFALKYDGMNLAILASIFRAASTDEFVAFILSKPTGKYARKLWFLYEFLTGVRLPIDDLRQGNYVELLDSDQYYTLEPSTRVQRQRINNNLLGTREFCPTIRRSESLRQFNEAEMLQRCQQIVTSYPPALLKRALSYLYTKETKSSFEIEHIQPNTTRTEKFIALLQLAERDDFCEKSALIELQNRIVDPRFRETDYRNVQNYVGETVAWQQERIHYACPKPEDIHALMEGLIAAHQQMKASDVPRVIHAAAIAFGFVFLHPFDDGNGRIHRFLIHNILATQGFTPSGIMFPISAAVLKNQAEYDASLEAFSRPLMQLVEYTLDENGCMTVSNDTAPWYAYMDMTAQAEALARFIQLTIDTELVNELSFLARYDEMKKAIQDVVDMPDRSIDLLIRCCMQNQGRLSEKKRQSHFAFLSDKETTKIEQAIHDTNEQRNDNPPRSG